ncbi:hypothetical protein K435DRAFT_820965 [Dendrothele bispora CBS 962.96]|uniref:Uncharacterized protein n=1 Tax=Dendrothele bispora (strain CBS 962.96) TaxID=1314807 RepID=A0A4S8LP09_DENBC|nr:hypothetical protein K435DRAFT_820965 [Dendrothele bispora CBS 962.96]
MAQTTYTLLQFGSDPFNNRYEDQEGRPAFTLYASQAPNLVIRLSRESNWAQQIAYVMGPDNSYFYFGPGNTAGYIMYGNNHITLPMSHLSRQQREGSTSRYFTAQSGRHYKWRITPQRMEVRCICCKGHDGLTLCMDGRNCICVWEVISSPENEYDARVTFKPAALALVTEIMTTLILNRMYLALGW